MNELDKTIKEFILSKLDGKQDVSVDVFASEIRSEIDKLTAQCIGDIINNGLVQVRLNNDRKLFIKYKQTN